MKQKKTQKRKLALLFGLSVLSGNASALFPNPSNDNWSDEAISNYIDSSYRHCQKTTNRRNSILAYPGYSQIIKDDLKIVRDNPIGQYLLNSTPFEKIATCTVTLPPNTRAKMLYSPIHRSPGNAYYYEFLVGTKTNVGNPYTFIHEMLHHKVHTIGKHNRVFFSHYYLFNIEDSLKLSFFNEGLAFSMQVTAAWFDKEKNPSAWKKLKNKPITSKAVIALESQSNALLSDPTEILNIAFNATIQNKVFIEVYTDIKLNSYQEKMDKGLARPIFNFGQQDALKVINSLLFDWPSTNKKLIWPNIDQIDFEKALPPDLLEKIKRIKREQRTQTTMRPLNQKPL